MWYILNLVCCSWVFPLWFECFWYNTLFSFPFSCSFSHFFSLPCYKTTQYGHQQAKRGVKCSPSGGNWGRRTAQKLTRKPFSPDYFVPRSATQDCVSPSSGFPTPLALLHHQRVTWRWNGFFPSSAACRGTARLCCIVLFTLLFFFVFMCFH